jgi:hypothetical protein
LYNEKLDNLFSSPTYEQIKKIRNICSMHGLRKQKTVVSKPQRDPYVERRLLKLISCK